MGPCNRTIEIISYDMQGRIQDFKLGGAHLKKLVERREARKLFGYFVWKITILRQKIIFFSNFRGHATGAPPPPLIRPWYVPRCRCEHRLCTDYLKDDSYPPILYKEDTKEIIISRKSKDRQCSGQKKRDKKSNNCQQSNTQKTINRATRTP